MKVKTIRVDMNISVPENERFAIFEGSRIEHDYEYSKKEVIFYYDRVTRFYTYLYKDPRGAPSLLPTGIDLQDHFLKGDDVFGWVEPTPVSRWKMVSANECLYSMLKTALDFNSNHDMGDDDLGCDDYRLLFLSAYSFFEESYTFQSGGKCFTAIEQSPLMELNWDFDTRSDEFLFASWTNECENVDPEEIEDYEEREESWKKYFEKKRCPKQVNILPSKKTQHKEKVMSVEYEDGYVFYKTLREMFPDMVIITADQWDREDAIIRFDSPEQAKILDKMVNEYHGLDEEGYYLKNRGEFE